MLSALSNEQVKFLEDLRESFEIPYDKIPMIIDRFHRSMEQGLTGLGGDLKMLPSFLSRPEGTEEGRYLALDLGGTNVRVLEVLLNGEREAFPVATSRFVIPTWIMGGSGEALFDFLASCVENFLNKHKKWNTLDYPLAFTFSFPVEQHSISSGTLINWTKGFTVYNVVGKDVVAMMNDALRQRGLKQVRVVALLNDTVGTLMAGAYVDPSCDMGVIIGTGTNACYPEHFKRIKKLGRLDEAGEMIINMEWGNFDGFEKNRFDIMLDEISFNPGQQAMEKMVSAMYIGEIARLVIVEMTEAGLLTPLIKKNFERPFNLSAKKAIQIANGDMTGLEKAPSIKESERKVLSSICRMVIERSARIAAVAVIAVLIWMDPSLVLNHTVAVDGALFENNPFYRVEMERTLFGAWGKRAERIRLIPVNDGSGIGSAIAGAVSEWKKRTSKGKR